MSYRLGVDVGGTFTDLLLVNEKSGALHTAKVPSTPEDSSIGVFNGITKVCSNANVDPSEITSVMHGTTVATNTILTGTGAKVGLITTKGYRQVLQIARSFVPGGLGGWVIYNKSDPIAPLSLTIEADERISAKGEVLSKLKKGQLAKDIKELSKKGVEAITVSLINSYANDQHEKEIKREIQKKKLLPKIPVSLSSQVVPEMQEYERTITTVANSYVRPKVAEYVKNLQRGLKKRMNDVKLRNVFNSLTMFSAKEYIRDDMLASVLLFEKLCENKFRVEQVVHRDTMKMPEGIVCKERDRAKVVIEKNNLAQSNFVALKDGRWVGNFFSG